VLELAPQSASVLDFGTVQNLEFQRFYVPEAEVSPGSREWWGNLYLPNQTARKKRRFVVMVRER
jgi:hypothetical protein